MKSSLFWQLFSLTPALILIPSATTAAARTLPAPSPHNNNLPAAAAPEPRTSPPTRRRAIKIATRQLIEHDGFMHIAYEDRVIYSTTLYRRTLSTALTRIIYNIHTHGDDAVLEEPFVHTIGTMTLQAANDRRSASRDLTWGILGEAVGVLEEFTALRPYPMTVALREGLDGRGWPIGEMEVMVNVRGNNNGSGGSGGVLVE
ncbi:MAG: hypothetical protein Q9182_001243 [Xanthomendoza sp. 2 TL-2023]